MGWPSGRGADGRLGRSSKEAQMAGLATRPGRYAKGRPVGQGGGEADGPGQAAAYADGRSGGPCPPRGARAGPARRRRGLCGPSARRGRRECAGWRLRGGHVGRPGERGEKAPGDGGDGGGIRATRCGADEGRWRRSKRGERGIEPPARIGPRGSGGGRRRRGATATATARGEGGGEGRRPRWCSGRKPTALSNALRREKKGKGGGERGVYRGGAASRGRRRCGRGAAPAEGAGGRDGARSSFGSPRR